MSPDKKDFYGQDVPSAIREACESLGVAQENLVIEVIETGSKGIFGLIRKKAHIRVASQPVDRAASPMPEETETRIVPTAVTDPVRQHPAHPAPVRRAETALEGNQNSDTEDRETDDTNGDDDEDLLREPVELSSETLAVVKSELERLLELMACPPEVSVENQDGTVLCTVGDACEPILTSQEGKTLDSLQYLLRKIVSRKIPGRIQLSIDVGNYRAKRHEELRELALRYAAQVKEDGKTQVIPSLNPSERRVVHVSLQDDPSVRSRSIGEGLFKKILIYRPGKTRKSSVKKRSRGGNRRRGHGRQEE